MQKLIEQVGPSQDDVNLAQTLKRLIRAEHPSAFIRTVDGELPSMAALEVSLILDGEQVEFRVSVEDQLAPTERQVNAMRKAEAAAIAAMN